MGYVGRTGSFSRVGSVRSVGSVGSVGSVVSLSSREKKNIYLVTNKHVRKFRYNLQEVYILLKWHQKN